MPPNRTIRFVKLAKQGEWGIPLAYLLGMKWGGDQAPATPAAAQASPHAPSPAPVEQLEVITLYTGAGTVSLTGNRLWQTYVRLALGTPDKPGTPENVPDRSDKQDPQASNFITIKEREGLQIGELE